MEKEFDEWSIQKKRINKKDGHKLYASQEVWWASLGINVGFEQDGTGKDFDRPVLVLKDFNQFVCLIVPLTTSPKRSDYYVDAGILGDVRAAAIISQIRFIDTRRLTQKLGTLSNRKFKIIRNAVRSMI